jgi:hypothetical protein
MSEYSAKTLRDKAKARARNLAKPGDYVKDQMTSSADWSPASPINSEVKTGARPISPRAYKRGGAVKKASGGEIADSIVNRNVKKANDERPGAGKHVGGFKCGGKAKRAEGGGVLDKKAVGAVEVKPTRAKAEHYAKGGKANWIAGAIKNKGALHKQLGVPEGEKIPAKKLAKAADKPGKLGQRARLAETLKGFKKADGGGLVDKLNKLTGYKSESQRQQENMPNFATRKGVDYGDPAMKGDRDRLDRMSSPYKKGGRTARATGGAANASPLSTAAKAVSGKAAGGRKNAKTDIKINILAGGQKPMPAGPINLGGGMPGAPAPVSPPAMPPIAPPPAAMPTGEMPMARKAGGRISKVASSYKDMTAGSGSGEGRLQKTDVAKKHKDAPAKKRGGGIRSK